MPETLPVLFRMSEGQCTAVFPTLPESWGYVTCYAHIGQHGTCSRQWYQGTTPATPEQYAGLLAELQGIYGHALDPGDTAYTLKVIQRWTRGA